MKKFSIQSLTNERLYLQCKIKDVLAEKEEYYAVNAIIDTGATGSAISVGLAEKLNLISAGKIYVESAAYNGYVDFYFLNISVNCSIVYVLITSYAVFFAFWSILMSSLASFM